VEQILVPTPMPGDIDIMDNVSVHKVVGIRETYCGTRRDTALPSAV
jgi:hypothetical protein